MAVVEVKNLTKRYGKHTAVEGLSFSVESGQIYGFLGPNGAGKSTTMNIMTGYLAPSGGEVLINGHDMMREPEEAKRCIGYLPEVPPVYPDMTVREYLQFAAELKQIPKAERKQQIAEVMELTKVTEVSERLIKNLSKGYRQRVGLAQAILGEPDVIILDPPRDGVHPKALTKIIDYGVEHILYISCKASSLARDLEVFLARGYRTKRCVAIDQFPWTAGVETCVLLSRKKSGGKSTKIEIEIDLSEADRRECIGTATYQEIKDYIWEHYQTKVSHLYIAQIKKKCGLDVGENFNKPKTEGNKVPNCPPEKERMIREALEYFGMIKR